MQTKTSMKTKVLTAGLVLGLSATGIAVANSDAHADSKKNQWQYQCFQSDDVGKITTQSNTMGQEGWEMITAANSGDKATIWCFKRPLWKVVTKK